MDVQTQHKHSGLAAAKRIKKAFPNIKIVIVTSLVDPQVLERAKTGAADSLWYKDHGTEESALSCIFLHKLLLILTKLFFHLFRKPQLAFATPVHFHSLCPHLVDIFP